MATVTQRFAGMLATSQLLTTGHRAKVLIPISRKSVAQIRKRAAPLTATMSSTALLPPTSLVTSKFLI